MSSRLRSSTACLRCRARRKKCDEQRPICRNCQRSGFDCLWGRHDGPLIHFLPVNKIIRETYTVLLTKNEVCTFVPVMQSLHYSPSAGHHAIRSNAERQLLENLAGLLSMLCSTTVARDPNFKVHEFSIALNNLWVRDAMVAFAAFTFSSRDASLRKTAYAHYNTAIREIRHRLAAVDCAMEREELLVATLFLGMIEINNPENSVFPLLHFEAVGHLLHSIAIHPNHSATQAQTIFHRIALESYLYHVSMCSLYYPATDRYTQLSPVVEQILNTNGLSAGRNIIITLDTNIYRSLFGLTLLARTSSEARDYHRRLQQESETLTIMNTRAENMLLAESPDDMYKHFWSMTRIALGALNIYLAKIRHRDILAVQPQIRDEWRIVVEILKSLVTIRAWTGNFVWILTILACAAHTVVEFGLLQDKTEQLKAGLWGGDLQRLTRVWFLIRRLRHRAEELAAGSHGTVQPQDHDTLALLLQKEGVLFER